MTSTRKRILLVHANDELHRRWSAQLEQSGCDVRSGRDVRTAIDLAIRCQPHVIVAQIPLPDAVGYHFVRTLRGTVEHDVRLIGIRRAGEQLDGDASAAGFDWIFDDTVDLAGVLESFAIAARG